MRRPIHPTDCIYIYVCVWKYTAMSEVNGMSSIQQFSASTPSAFLIWVTCGGWPSGRSWWLWVAHLILQLVWTTCSSNSRWWSAPKSGSHSFPVSSIYIYIVWNQFALDEWHWPAYIYIYSHHVQSIWGLGFVHLDDHVDSNTGPWPGDMFWECQMFSWYQSIFHYIYINVYIHHDSGPMISLLNMVCETNVSWWNAMSRWTVFWWNEMSWHQDLQ